MKARGWEPPDTPTSLTGGGGLHYLFSHPGFHLPNKVAIAPGIDLSLLSPVLGEMERRTTFAAKYANWLVS